MLPPAFAEEPAMLTFDSSFAVTALFLCGRLQLMFETENLCRTLADDHARGQSVAGRYSRHNRSIRDAKVVDPVHSQIAVHHRHGSPPIFAVPVSCQKLVAASQPERSSSAPFRLPGITSRLANGRSGAELPTSRQSSTHAIAALKSSASASAFASIRASDLETDRARSGAGDPGFLDERPPQQRPAGDGAGQIGPHRNWTWEPPLDRQANQDFQARTCSSRRRLPRTCCCASVLFWYSHTQSKATWS